MNNLEIGKIIRAKILKINKTWVVFGSKDNVIFNLNITEVSDYFIADLNEMFKVGEIKELIITEKITDNEYNVSYKRIHPKYLKNPFNFKMDKKTAKFDSLLDFTNKGINYGK
ncbi:hypothetical protein [Mycoplasma struthionis]|uniref:S1 motif domain-containing protein n=1 Tax=Mycoplasma struthionis TaxID=538220 RepID=A0A3G8LG65_9MOLU|nr:hypothetical protein [Mycoplasma struthionis]AZG68653.1 hypothetical protein EGN60_01570 [Mycoplasma struthionis]TPI01907.1 hypothetical protein FJM01_01425 [Mycoplasma struthionis]